jgi:hypothetical protein
MTALSAHQEYSPFRSFSLRRKLRSWWLLMAFPPRMTSPATCLYLSNLLTISDEITLAFLDSRCVQLQLAFGSFNIAGVYRRHTYCLLSSFVCGSLIPRDFLFIPGYWCTVGFESIWPLFPDLPRNRIYPFYRHIYGTVKDLNLFASQFVFVTLNSNSKFR